MEGVNFLSSPLRPATQEEKRITRLDAAFQAGGQAAHPGCGGHAVHGWLGSVCLLVRLGRGDGVILSGKRGRAGSGQQMSPLCPEPASRQPPPVRAKLFNQCWLFFQLS